MELPLKAIVRGYSYAIVPISWRNRKYGEPKLKIKEMGSRYFFICAYIWLEKYFSRGDYRSHPGEHGPEAGDAGTHDAPDSLSGAAVPSSSSRS